MNELRRRRLGVALMMILVAVLVGIGAYRMGVAQGLALASVELEGGRQAVYHGHGWYGYGPWGFGFGFGFFVPFLFFAAWFAVARMLFWRGPFGRGPWHHDHRRRWRDFDSYDGPDGPRSFDEWHRRAHERMHDRMHVEPPPPPATMV